MSSFQTKTAFRTRDRLNCSKALATLSNKIYLLIFRRKKEVILPSLAGENMYNKIATIVNKKQGNVHPNRIG